MLRLISSNAGVIQFISLLGVVATLSALRRAARKLRAEIYKFQQLLFARLGETA
jgi:hypothetical protein